MSRIVRGLALPLALAAFVSVGAGVGSAQFVPAPVVTEACYQPPVVVAAYPPAPVVSYYPTAPVTPVVSYYPAAPAVSYYAPAPVVSYYAPPVVYAAPAVSTTYRYGLFGRRSVTYTNYPAYYYR